MRRAALPIALLAAGGVAAFLLLRDGPRTPPSSLLRPAPAVPTPTVEQKVAFFYGLLRSGKTLVIKAPVAGAAPFDVPVWNEIGGNALLELGEPALAFLTAPARDPEYVQAPNVLVTILDLLARAPGSPQVFPFLERWLDERNCPPPVPGSDWPEDIRLHVFGALKARPVAAAAPACLAELDRPRRVHDLRGAAISILLEVGEADVLNRIYPTLPPTPETPEPDMRAAVLQRLFAMAAPSAGDRNRAQAEALEPMLALARDDGRPFDRIAALGILHRLGKPGAEEALRRSVDENRGNELLAWTALKLLAADRADPFVRDACLERVRTADTGVGFTTAVSLLAQWWPEEVLPRFLEWARLGVLDPYMVLPAMLLLDRELVLGWLRGELRGSDMAKLLRALSFVAGERLPDLVPELLELARRLEPSNRPPVYRTLVVLRAPGVEALLLAELAAGVPDALRGAAAAELLNLGGAAGEARLAELLRAGDGAVLEALLVRTRTLGGVGVPATLVPAVLEALFRMPSEDGRRMALLVLRFRGRFDDVREGLALAYRSEPSRRVAQEIGGVIDELAHR